MLHVLVMWSLKVMLMSTTLGVVVGRFFTFQLSIYQDDKPTLLDGKGFSGVSASDQTKALPHILSTGRDT
jgi:hypothetical protein